MFVVLFSSLALASQSTPPTISTTNNMGDIEGRPLLVKATAKNGDYWISPGETKTFELVVNNLGWPTVSYSFYYDNHTEVPDTLIHPVDVYFSSPSQKFPCHQIIYKIDSHNPPPLYSYHSQGCAEQVKIR